MIMNGLQEWYMKVKIIKKPKLRIILKRTSNMKTILTVKITKVKIKMNI